MEKTKNHFFRLSSIRVAALFLTLTLIFSNCKKEIECSGFNTSDSSEFTYTIPDTLTFKNETSGEFQIVIKDIILSEPYTFECRDLYKICPCNNYIEALVTDTKTQTPYTFLKMEQSDASEMQYFKYNVQGYQFEFDFINELPYIDQMDHLTYYSTITLGNVSYNEVIMITNSDFETNDIYRVYFNKGNGVLRFIEKSTNQIWTIQNE
jgi:hypothetical protein